MDVLSFNAVPHSASPLVGFLRPSISQRARLATPPPPDRTEPLPRAKPHRECFERERSQRSAPIPRNRTKRTDRNMDEDRLDTISVNPWWDNVEGPYLTWKGPVGIKEDGGGCTRHHGLVGEMVIRRAVHNKDVAAIKKAVESGHDVNEVEGAGNTPLHAAAYEGWVEGAELLLSLGAKIDASNNAGDRPYHTAMYLGQDEMVEFLKKKGASEERGLVLIQDHMAKVAEFFKKECWAHHPKPHQDFIDDQRRKDKNTKDHFAKHPELYP